MSALDDYDPITDWLALPEAQAALERRLTDLGLRVEDLDSDQDVRMDIGRMADGTTGYRFCLRRELLSKLKELGIPDHREDTAKESDKRDGAARRERRREGG